MIHLPAGLREISAVDFPAAVKANTSSILVVVGARWCHDTKRMIEEVLPQFIKRYAGKVNFWVVFLGSRLPKIHISEIFEDWKITRYPTLLIYKNGSSLDDPLISEQSAEDQAMDVADMLEKLAVP